MSCCKHNSLTLNNATLALVMHIQNKNLGYSSHTITAHFTLLSADWNCKCADISTRCCTNTKTGSHLLFIKLLWFHWVVSFFRSSLKCFQRTPKPIIYANRILLIKLPQNTLHFKTFFSALQTGVKVIIIISIIMVILVVIYAILYRLCKGRCGGKEK